MSWLKVSAVAGALAAQITTTMAADMPGTLPPPGYPTRIVERPPQLFDANFGWYLRGDIGYAWGLIDSAQSVPGIPNPTANKLGNGYFGGVGGGFRSKWLRTDVTFDYNSALKYTGTIATPGDVTAKMTAWSALFNGYIDLGTWYRMTPYIGAGAGAALVNMSGYSNAAVPFASGESHAQWNFAWAGMAGVGFAISPNTVIDLGYRYINFGDAKTGSDASGAMTFKNLAAHEVRIGLRWSFDDFAYR
ncbi:MAG TPA: outer membrane protein [Pseudolabrys sp.]